MAYDKISIPATGERIKLNNDGTLNVPERPIVGYVQGDGIGIDVAPVMRRVVDAAVTRAYQRQRSIAWMEIYAGELAVKLYGNDQWLPDESLDAMQRYLVSIKGPLTTPVGEGMRSLNVAIRQDLDLYACVRPIRYFSGTPTPMKDSAHTHMVVFRENTEDIYAGIEWPAGSAEVRKLISFLQKDMGVTGIRFPDSSGLGIKPVSSEGSKRLVRKAIKYAIDNDHKSVTLVHKGNIMKYTEGAFRNWGYEIAREEFGAQIFGEGPWCKFPNPRTGGDIVIKDVIADNFLQQILLKPQEFDVIATLNLNGDYISDALAAQVGGLGIAPGGNIGDGIAVFEATHGTAPRHAGKNRVNPGSMILSAEMMLRYLGWNEAADLIIKGVSGAIASKTVTYDLALVRADMGHRKQKAGEQPKSIQAEIEELLPGATLVTTAGFGDTVVAHMDDPRRRAEDPPLKSVR